MSVLCFELGSEKKEGKGPRASSKALMLPEEHTEVVEKYLVGSKITVNHQHVIMFMYSGYFKDKPLSIKLNQKIRCCYLAFLTLGGLPPRSQITHGGLLNYKCLALACIVFFCQLSIT